MKMNTVCSLMLLALPFSSLASDEFQDQTNAIKSCPGNFFTQKAVVFDSVAICATNKVDDEKLAYAASVMAQWLDNNQDGEVDEPKLLPLLKQNRATLLMSSAGFNDRAFDAMSDELDGLVGQDLAANETNPRSRRDASQEEIHHLIVNAGWQNLYPAVFSDQKEQASSLYKQWQKAERQGSYSYDDPTCDDRCKTVEFFYLATAAYLGSSADLESDEMMIKNKESLKKKLPGVVNIMEASEYQYPVYLWPDGHYRHQNRIKFN